MFKIWWGNNIIKINFFFKFTIISGNSWFFPWFFHKISDYFLIAFCKIPVFFFPTIVSQILTFFSLQLFGEIVILFFSIGLVNSWFLLHDHFAKSLDQAQVSRFFLQYTSKVCYLKYVDRKILWTQTRQGSFAAT